MFEICKDISYVSAKKELVRRLMISFNKPIVAASSHSAQPSQAYMAALKDEQGFSVYICIYLTIERATIFYKYADIIKDAEQCLTAEEEALQFMEEMGFIIDDSHFESLDIPEQERLLTSVPMFTQPANVKVKTGEDVVVAAEEPVEEQQAKKETIGEEAVAVIEKIEELVEEKQGNEEFGVRKETEMEYVEDVSGKVESVKSEEKPALIEEKVPIPIAENAAEKTEEIKEKWVPELFLSKFRMRAAAERMKK